VRQRRGDGAWSSSPRKFVGAYVMEVGGNDTHVELTDSGASGARRHDRRNLCPPGFHIKLCRKWVISPRVVDGLFLSVLQKIRMGSERVGNKRLSVRTLSWFRGAAACEPWWCGCRPCHVRNRLRVVALGYQPCQLAVRGRCLPALSCGHCRVAAYEHHRATTSGELHVPTSLHSPSSKEMFCAKLYVASICFKCFKCFRVMLQVCSYGCCKSISGCCICCNGCTRMLQTSVLKVSFVFLRMLQVCLSEYVCCKLLFSKFHLFFYVCCKCVYLNVVYVYNGFKCFSGAFGSGSDPCFKCFICFQTYIAIVASSCFKTRLSVACSSSPFSRLAWYQAREGGDGLHWRGRAPRACGRAQ
jgi:hypothetical protein